MPCVSESYDALHAFCGGDALPASTVVSLAACLLQAAAPCFPAVSSWLLVWSSAWLLRLGIS